MVNRIARPGRTILFVALILGAVTLHAQTHDDRVGPTTQPVTDEPVTDATNLVYPVAFELGETRLLPGDDIHIDSVVGSAPAIQPGNVYLVTGTYKLASHPEASLSTNTTTRTSSGSTRNHDPAAQPRNTQVRQGDGRFKVYLHMGYDGYPHLSFYSAHGGGSFASVYFGTGGTVLKPHPSDGQ